MCHGTWEGELLLPDCRTKVMSGSKELLPEVGRLTPLNSSYHHKYMTLELARLFQLFLLRCFPSLERRSKKEDASLPYSQMIY